MTAKIVKAAYMAGARIPLFEIAEKIGEDSGQVRRWLAAHGIVPETNCGPSIHVVVPLEPFLPDLDQVGADRRMSREEIAAEILRIVMSRGAGSISETLDRGIGGA